MTKEELERATGQELIEQRDYCGVDGYYGVYLDNVNAEMLKRFNRLADLEKENAVLEKRIERAKECMKKLLFIINSDPANYNCKGLVKDAEYFIHNRTCNIRQQGQHCISETRCIMCDK